MFSFPVLSFLFCLRTPVSRRLLDFPAHQRMDRIHQTVAPDLDQVIQGVNAPPAAVPVPVPFPGHIDQAVMFLMPVIWPVALQHARFMELQVCEQVRLPCLLDLLFGYAGHSAGTDFRFIVLRLLPVMK